MVGPEEDEESEVEEFESVEESEDEPQPLEEFETFDNTPPEDIKSSGFKARTGQIPGYEPTVDEVLSYAMGKTKDPSEPTPRREARAASEDDPEALASDSWPEADEEEGEAVASDEDLPGSDEVEGDELGDIFDEEE